MAPTLQSDSRQTKSRRVSKHLTERKRRARINDSLLQLKTIVYPAVKNEVVQNSKMEKADILDMTLCYVKDIQQKNREGKEPSIDQFHAGYSECLSQVSSFLSSCESMPLETRRTLLTHLSDKSLASATMEDLQQAPLSPTESRLPSPPQVNHHHMSSLPIGSPSGIVYLLPAQAIQSFAQTTVIPCQTQRSPTHTVASHATDVNILLTPPHSPVSEKQHSSPGSCSSYRSIIFGDASMVVAPSVLPVVKVSKPVSSATEDADVWRPW